MLRLKLESEVSAVLSVVFGKVSFRFVLVSFSCSSSVTRCNSPDFTQEKLELLESYLKVVNIFRSYEEAPEDPQYSEVNSPSGSFKFKLGT